MHSSDDERQPLLVARVMLAIVYRDELLTELAKLDTNGKDRRGAGQSSRRQRHRHDANGGAHEATGDYESDGGQALEAGANVNASLMSEDVRLLAALN